MRGCGEENGGEREHVVSVGVIWEAERVVLLSLQVGRGKGVAHRYE